MNENSPAEGIPLHSFSRSESADVRNVGTGQPRPGDEEGAPVLHSSPVQVNPALQPPQVNPTLQQSSTQANPSLQPFIEGLNELGLAITEQQSQQFLRYQQELLDWNTRMNLTSITNPEEVLIKHFLDSLSLLMVYDAPAARVLDIGAGAGFPGLPLKILRPQWHIVLLEATGKKVRFLQHIIETLQLKDVVAVHGRAEELGHRADYRGLFDLVTARAVTSLPALIEYAAPFCCVGGQMIFPKKGDLAEELARGKRAASQLGTRFKADVQVMLSGLEDDRYLLLWEQTRKCPDKFARNGGVIAKKPLGLF